MLNYLRESLHWMHLVIFKPFKLEDEAKKFSLKQTTIIILKVNLVAAATSSLLLVTVGGIAEIAGYSFDWDRALKTLGYSLGIGLVPGLILGIVPRAENWRGLGLILGVVLGPVFATGRGLGFGLIRGLRLELGLGLVNGLGFGLGLGLMLGLVIGLVFGTERKLVFGAERGLFFGLVSGLGFGLVIGLLIGLRVGLDYGSAEVSNYALSFLSAFFLMYFRIFHLLPYVWQYARADKAHDPFRLFHHSPIYWDEVIATPLPSLKDWLISLVRHNRERGLAEILFVAENRPFQRKAALESLFAITEQDLQHIGNLNALSKAADLLKAFPAEGEALPKGLDDARRRLSTISILAQDYQTRLTPNGQLKVLVNLRSELETFRSAMALTAAPVGTAFQLLAARWLDLVKKTETEARAHLRFSALLNPYVAGVPLQPRDFGLLRGRRDIIRAIEKNILNTEQRPALLLYGRRRTGKSSTLLNLPRLLSSQFEPIYLDCQDAKWHESDQAFCYNLAREIFERLFQGDDVKGIRQPQEAQFEKNAFTRLDEYLDQFERLATERGKRILLAFDEYEGLEESIAGGDISKNVLGKLRNIIQHRARIVVLVSGSHRFEELTGVNWASYLINTRTLELSFLDEPSARELLTEPVPQLRYEDGVLEEILRLTHCQPYLLQAVASELVNHLNELQKTTATRADLDAAVNKVLTSAGAYFANTWREDNSATEQTVLRAYAEGAGERVATAEFQAAMQSLIRKEMMERDGDGYRLAVPLFGLWILRNQVD